MENINRTLHFKLNFNFEFQTTRADNPGLPGGGHRSGLDTICGGQEWTTGGIKFFNRWPAQNVSLMKNKPGTAQVGAISKAQKNSKTTFSTTGDNKSSQKTKS